jgi:hypothetical protein
MRRCTRFVAVEGGDGSDAGWSHRCRRKSSIVVFIVQRGFDVVVSFRFGSVRFRFGCAIPGTLIALEVERMNCPGSNLVPIKGSRSRSRRDGRCVGGGG